MKKFVSSKPGAVALLLLLMLIWAFSYIIIRITVSQGIIPPMSLAFLRFVVAAAVLYLLPIKGEAPTRRDRPTVALMGVFGMALYFAFENNGLMFTTATNASILVALIPAMTTLGAALLLGEKFTAANIAGLIVAFAASVFIIWNGSVNFNLNPLGDLLILLSVVSWTVYTLIGRNVMARCSAALVARQALLTAALCLAPFFIYELLAGKLGGVTVTAGLGVVYLGVLCTALAYTIWGHCVRILGPVYASNLLYLQSVITVACAWITIREPVNAFLLVCMAALILGVFLSNAPLKPRPRMNHPRLK
jgi:drug/metabolite transporter (DMT)-like permease